MDRIARPGHIIAGGFYTRGGVPAKPIRRRFDGAVIERLEKLRWWDWDIETIRRSIPAIQSGNIAALERMAERRSI